MPRANLPAASGKPTDGGDDQSFWARLLRRAELGAGLALMAVGLPLALLPLHLGLPILLFGLVLVLRSSVAARRKFVEQQRKRPRLLFPIRRLLRRDPEVLLVAWQQVLRLERMILPQRWRMARTLRQRLVRPARARP